MRSRFFQHNFHAVLRDRLRGLAGVERRALAGLLLHLAEAAASPRVTDFADASCMIPKNPENMEESTAPLTAGGAGGILVEVRERRRT